MIRSLAAALLSIATLAIVAVPATAQSSGPSGSDVAALIVDVGKYINAERKFAAAKNTSREIATMIAEDRQRELLGLDADLDVQDLASARQSWWIENVLQPALDIAANPAASCGFARYMLERIYTMTRQAQLLGLEGVGFGTLGDSDSIMSRAVQIARVRCLEDAFNHCMETGVGEELIEVLTGWGRQFELAGVEHTDFDERAAYLFRRCTVYRLIYHLEMEQVATDRRSSTADGTFTLLFEFGPEGRSLAGVAHGEWSTRVPDTMSPDMLLTDVNCGPAAISCEIDESPSGGSARGLIRMKRTVHEQTLSYREPPAYMPDQSPVIKIETTEREVGEDRVGLRFAPPDVTVEARYRPGYGPLTGQGPGTEIYHLAMGSMPDNAPALPGPWTRVGHPTLFESTSNTVNSRGFSRGPANFGVKGKYTLTHRPDLFPPEEIQPELEFHGEDTRPPRIPLPAG